MRRVLIGVAMVFLVTGAAADDWPQWRGPNRDGRSSETNWLQQWPPVQVWRKLIKTGFSSPVVSEGRLYVTGLEGYGAAPSNAANVVYCLDAETGSEIWSYSYRNTNWITQQEGGAYMGSKSTPTVCGGELYTLDENGGLFCFDKVTGNVIWSKDITAAPPKYGFSCAPLVEGNLVILNAGGQGVAVDRNPPHNIVWPVTTNSLAIQGGHSSAVAYTATNGQRCVVMTWTYQSSDVLGINALNGQILWKLTNAVDHQMSEDVVLYGDKMYTSGGYGILFSPGINLANVIWKGRRSYAGWNSSTPVVDGDYAYYLNGRKLQCIDLRDGSTKWSQTPEGMSADNGQLVVSDGKLLMFAGHKLYVLKATPAGYDSEGRAPVPVADLTLASWSNSWWKGYSCTAPALANGKIYCRDFDQLVCYRASPKINRAPVARNDAAIARKDTAAVLNVLANDSDEDFGDAVTVVAVTPPGHGVASVNGGTNVTYTPAAGYTGADSFSYTVTDCCGGSATGEVSVVVAASGNGLAVAATATPTNGWGRSLTVQFASMAGGGQVSVTNDTTDGLIGMPTASDSDPGLAFDNDTNTCWSGNTNATMNGTVWIQYAYWNGLRKRVEEYSITAGYWYSGSSYYYPKSWKLMGSNDRGATWTELDSRSGQSFTGYQKKRYTVTNPGSYATYRLSVPEAGLYGYCYLYEIELLEKGYVYAWSFGDGTTSTLRDPLHAYATNGNYRAQVVATDALGSRATNSVLVSASVPVTTGLAPMKMRIALGGYDRSEPLTNFPVLVVLSNSVAGGGFSYNQCASPYGWDLRFRNENESMELEYEVESWNPGGMSYIWIRIPVLTNHATIWANWGDSALAFAPAACTTNGAAWDDSFRAVWHLDALSDSTANRNTVTNKGSSETRQGIVGNGRLNRNSNLSVPDSSSLSVTGSITLEGWFRMDSQSSGTNWLFAKDTNSYQLWYDATNAGLTLRDGAGPETVSWPYKFESRRWYHAAMVADLGPARQIRFYLDGAQIGEGKATTKSSIADTTGALLLLRTAWGDGYFDELRISGGTRSENWIRASWLNVVSNAAFTSFGVPQPVSGGADAYGIPYSWTIQYFGSTNAPGSGAMDDPDGDGMNNFAEYRAGTIPSQAGSVLTVEALKDSGRTNMVISWPSVAGKYYRITATTNLMQGFRDVMRSNIVATPAMNATTVDTGQAGCRYYRVSVE
ncbi:MAG: hypothetical protein C0404_01875 [Verrucomicrobia bacterium]|nr:hypothetical protein [Verrucomicrobiota bacterium]